MDSSRKHSAMRFLDARPALFRDDFRDWLDENFHIYLEFERRAVLLAGRRKHIGAKAIFEAIRYDSAIGELHGEWKCNNSATADCARLAMEMCQSLKGMFETRLGPLSRRGV